jgi:uncharacterized protein YjbI with pentapeptide repeats
MVGKPKGRIAPRIDESVLGETFAEQLNLGAAADATATDTILPPLVSPRGQPVTIDGCVLRSVTLSDPKAQRLRIRDTRIQTADLANIDLTGSLLERVEIVSTRLTGAKCNETQLRSVLFQECKLDLAMFRMAKLQQCVFENCNLSEADFYEADLSGAIFRKCDLSRADITHANLAGANVRDCRIDGMRGTPASAADLVISPDQAPLLITLFGVRVQW